MSAQAPAKVDRQTTTPFLLRLFYKSGSFHRLDDFDPSIRLPPHLQIYTWPTCTLSELTHLLLTALPSLLPPSYAGTRIAFRLVYGDTQGPTRPGVPARFISRELGSVVVGASTNADEAKNGGGDVDMDVTPTAADVKEALKQLDGEPYKSLGDAKFIIGDYVSCAILPPGPDGSVPAAPPPPSGPARGVPLRDGFGGGRGRENGFGGRGDFGGYGGRGGRGGGRFDDRGGGRFDDRGGGRFDDRSGGVPSGEWRRGEAPPEREGYWRGGAGGGGGGGRGGRGRGRW
ncbi:hypothetical protein K505DRAFT_307619 [Melanomma pulvis-pyrius CBS 109.77]|uniref:Sin3-associated polypeptide Sap18 n=1 Tax=Melanomma pulvis-pyrius CBS 109.77 TaxID=1314802 RepID=A0A6A6X9G2_9PLEO|nr:hypothetical protein K505DRAFT_307619 [Melanomma pulvis-pyrius CBS 109.77]